jgi:hypothetical protein
MTQIRLQKKRSVIALATLLTAVGIVGCNESVSLDQNSAWGFVFLPTQDAGGGAYRVAPNAVFFLGQITGIPDARVAPDSCFEPRPFGGESSSFEGVTFLDAGASITTKLGTVSTEIPRVVAGGATSYDLVGGGNRPFTPGDTVRITIPGATGGYPAATINGRTAEKFTMDPILVPTESKPIQLRWTPAPDTGSAMIISLRYRTDGSQQVLEIPCAFKDDGIDSILVTDHTPWSAASNSLQESVATRLRTSISTLGGTFLELISTFRLPTPTGPLSDLRQ